MLSCELLPSGYKRFVWLLTILHLLESNSLFYFSKTWKLLNSIRQLNESFKCIKQMSYEGVVGGSDSFTIIGSSGIGKSSAVSRAVSLITDKPFVEVEGTKICPFVVVQCPFDSSVKGLSLEILRKIDSVLETKYYTNAIRSHATTDVLIGMISQAALNHIGLLIIDEIQNVATSKNGKVFINSLTQLINNSGISICMVGTPECTVFFIAIKIISSKCHRI